MVGEKGGSSHSWDLIPYNRVEKQLMVVEEEEDIIDADGEDFEEEQVKKWLAVAWLSSGQTYVLKICSVT